MKKPREKMRSPDVITRYLTADGEKHEFWIEYKAAVEKTTESFDAQMKAYRNYIVHNGVKVPQLIFPPNSSFRVTVHSPARKPRITKPPGTLMQGIADSIFSKKTLDRVVNPIIADLQYEYFEALHEGRTAKAAWIRVRGFCTLWLALGLDRIGKTLMTVWRGVHPI